MKSQKSYFSSTAKKSIIIKRPKQVVWKKISNIIGLEWLEGMGKTTFLTNKKTGIGAIRELRFQDKNIIEEHIVDWKKGDSFSYIAVSGLPLRAYCANISLESVTKNSVKMTWKSYFNSKKMSKKEFDEFCDFIQVFYANSLKNLKAIME